VSNRALDATFAAELARADIWIPVRVADDGSTSLVILANEGQPFVAAFTSRELLDAATPGAISIAQSYEWVTSSIPDEVGVVFNPGQVPSLSLSHADAVALVGAERIIRPGETVRLGDPADEPTELLEHVATALQPANAVVEARRVWAQVGERPPGLVIGLGFVPEADANDKKLAFSAVGEAVGGTAVTFSIDLVELDPTDGFAAWMLENNQPFFTRA
jgi:hypothetical protein